MDKELNQEGEWRLWFLEDGGRKKVFACAGPEERMRVAYCEAVKAGREAILVDHLGVKQLPVDLQKVLAAEETNNWIEQEKFNAVIEKLVGSAFERIADIGSQIEAGDKCNAQKIDSIKRDFVQFAHESGSTQGSLANQVSKLRIDLDRQRDASVNREKRVISKIGQFRLDAAQERERFAEVCRQVDSIIERLKDFPEFVEKVSRGDEEPVIESDSIPRDVVEQLAKRVDQIAAQLEQQKASTRDHMVALHWDSVRDRFQCLVNEFHAFRDQSKGLIDQLSDAVTKLEGQNAEFQATTKADIASLTHNIERLGRDVSGNKAMWMRIDDRLGVYRAQVRKLAKELQEKAETKIRIRFW